MKLALALVVSGLISLASPMETSETDSRAKRSSMLDRMPLHYGKRLPQRSLRSILDRMSAGYGKRTPEDRQNHIMTVDQLVELISSEPALASKFVRRFLDTNGDGGISQKEAGQW